VRNWDRLIPWLALAVVMAATGATAAFAKLPKTPTWATALVAAVAFGAGLALDPVKRAISEMIEGPARRRATIKENTRLHWPSGKLMRVRECTDPTALGVHPA
jgi:hypothetical protein